MSFSFRNRGASEQGDAEATGSDRRRLLLLGGGGAAMAVVGVMAFVLVSTGGDAVVASMPASPAGTAAAPGVTSTASPTESPTSEPVRDLTGADPRDPFNPLVVAEAAGTGAAAATEITVGTSSSTGTSTGATAKTEPPALEPSASSTTSSPSSTKSSTPSTTTSSGSPAKTWFPSSTSARPTMASVKVSMAMVAGDNLSATLSVDGRKYSGVSLDKEFGDGFRLLEMFDGRCAAVKYQDQEPFDLCEKETRVLR